MTDLQRPSDPSTCESCGDEATTLALVQRLYVTPEAWDAEGRVDVADLEWWCLVCRTHYPHVDPTEGSDRHGLPADPEADRPSESGRG